MTPAEVRKVAARHREDMWHMLGVEPEKKWPAPYRNFWSDDPPDDPSKSMLALVAAGLAEDRGVRMGSRIFVLSEAGQAEARRLYDEEVARRKIKTWYYEIPGIRMEPGPRGTVRGLTRSKARYGLWLNIRDCYPDTPLTAIKIGPQVRTAPCPPPTS